MDEAFYRQVKGASCSQALVHIEALSLLDICNEDNKKGHKQSMSFLRSTDDLAQVTEMPEGVNMRGATPHT